MRHIMHDVMGVVNKRRFFIKALVAVIVLLTSSQVLSMPGDICGVLDRIVLDSGTKKYTIELTPKNPEKWLATTVSLTVDSNDENANELAKVKDSQKKQLCFNGDWFRANSW